MSDTSFCLEMQEKFTRVCDLKTSGDKIELLSLGFQQTAPSFFTGDNPQIFEKQADIIANLYSSLKIKKKIVDVVIPDSYTYSQIVEMPLLKEKELLSAIRYQSDEFIPMPLDETNLDIQILKEDHAAKKILVLIVATPKRLADRIQKTIESAGLKTGVLENELTAVGRLFSERLNKEKKDGAIIVVNFGFSSSSIYIVDSQNYLILSSRSFRIGLDLFLRDLKVNLSINDDKAYEVLKTIGFAKNGSVDVETILMPILKELVGEIAKSITLSKEKFNLVPSEVRMFNHNTYISLLENKVSEQLALPVSSLTLDPLLVQNPVYQSFSSDLPSFIAIIGGLL